MAKRVKSFQKDRYDREIRELDNRLNAYNSYLQCLSEIKEGASTLDEVEAYLNKKTGFVNPRMSADAMGVLTPYEKAVDFEALFIGINYSALDEVNTSKPYKQFKIAPAYRDMLSKTHTVYYTPEESKQIDSLEKALDVLNKLTYPFVESVIYNSREKTWLWSKQYTDANLRNR
jgi:hypothetical protein